MQQIIGRDLVSEWMRCGVGILDHEDVLSAHYLTINVAAVQCERSEITNGFTV